MGFGVADMAVLLSGRCGGLHLQPLDRKPLIRRLLRQDPIPAPLPRERFITEPAADTRGGIELQILSPERPLEGGGIVAFLRREVLPHAPDAWYVPDSVKIGYEISFTRYFYKPTPLRTLEEIRAGILALERETEGLLSEIVGGQAR
jgi:hypothetical protein